MTEAARSDRLAREIFLAGFMAGLPAENLAWAAPRLARNMQAVELGEGEVLYRKGDPTTGHYFVVSGEVRLEADGVPPWVLGARSLVGTVDLTLERPRSRTATATRQTQLLRMAASDWLAMLRDNFELRLRGIEGLADGVHELRVALGVAEAGPQRPPPPPFDLPLALAARVLLLRGVPVFARGEVQALIELARHADEVTLAAGEALVTHGEPGDSLYLVVSGAVTAWTRPSARSESFGPGSLVFGSRAVSSKDLGFEARTASPSRLLRICREDYFDAMEEHHALAFSAMKSLVAERELLTNEKARAEARAAEDGGAPAVPAAESRPAGGEPRVELAAVERLPPLALEPPAARR